LTVANSPSAGPRRTHRIPREQRRPADRGLVPRAERLHPGGDEIDGADPVITAHGLRWILGVGMAVMLLVVV